MSGKRPFAPGWDRLPFGQTSAGLTQRYSFNVDVDRADQNSNHTEGGLSNGHTTPMPAISRFGFHGGISDDVAPPTPKVSFDEHASQNPAPERNALFRMGRDLGRLETELRNATLLCNNVIQHCHKFELENDHLRQERDAAQLDCLAAQQQIHKLQQKLDQVRVTLNRANPFSTPPKRSFEAYRRPSTHSSGSPNSMVVPCNSPVLFSPMTSDANRVSPSQLAAPLFGLECFESDSASSSPLIMPAKLMEQPMRDILDKFFQHTEAWSFLYALTRPPGDANDTYIRSLKVACHQMCRPRDVDDILDDPAIRRFLPLAMINRALCQYFGPECIEGFDFAGRAELDRVVKELNVVRPQNPRQQNELLLQRSHLYSVAVKGDSLELWFEGRITRVLHDLLPLLMPFVPDVSKAAACSDLRRIVKDGFAIGQRMLNTPREWGVVFAGRGQRWDTHCMFQKDIRLTGNPLLTQSNGFAFVVRLGIDPSITEKEFASNTTNLQTLHYRSVLLVENHNQRIASHTPQILRRGGAHWS